MKTLSKMSFIVFLLLAITFISCEKEKIEEHNQKSNENNINTKTNPNDEWGLNNEWYWLTLDCFPTPLNCFDPIVVTPHSNKGESNFKSYVLKLDDAVLKGPDTISKFFLSDDFLVLFPKLSNSRGRHLEKLQSGEYAGTIINNNNKNYYLFGKEGKLNVRNPEFVLVIEFRK